MLFGVFEHHDETTDAVVEDIFSQMGEKQYFIHCVRVGRKVSAGKPCPIKVEMTMRNASLASQTIVNGIKLRGNSGTEGIYVVIMYMTKHQSSEQEFARAQFGNVR